MICGVYFDWTCTFVPAANRLRVGWAAITQKRSCSLLNVCTPVLNSKREGKKHTMNLTDSKTNKQTNKQTNKVSFCFLFFCILKLLGSILSQQFLSQIFAGVIWHNELYDEPTFSGLFAFHQHLSWINFSPWTENTLAPPPLAPPPLTTTTTCHYFVLPFRHVPHPYTLVLWVALDKKRQCYQSEGTRTEIPHLL